MGTDGELAKRVFLTHERELNAITSEVLVTVNGNCFTDSYVSIHTFIHQLRLRYLHSTHCEIKDLMTGCENVSEPSMSCAQC